MEILKFSYNWNNKLDCRCFSTIRIYNPEKHKLGMQFIVELKGSSKGIATVVDIKTFLLKDLTNGMAYIDTGYDKAECSKIITTMYKTVDFTTKKVAFIILSYDN